jgi:hypothetical protein
MSVYTPQANFIKNFDAANERDSENWKTYNNYV